MAADHDERRLGDPLALQHRSAAARLVARRHVGAADDQAGVDHRLREQHLRVGDRQQRRAVDHHEVGLAGEVFD